MSPRRVGHYRSPRAGVRRWLSGAAIVLVFVLGTAAPAAAHAQLEWTTPVQSSVLSAPPSQVVLHFDQAVEIDFGSMRVIGPQGQRVDEGGTHYPDGNTHAVAISLPGSLPAGTYVVAWRVISADSHPVHGAFYFSVGAAKGVGKASALAHALQAASGSTVVGVVYWFVRLIAFAALLMLVGVAVVALVARPPPAAVRRIWRMLTASWVTLLVCSVVGVAVQGVYAASLPLSDLFRPSLFNEVVHTRFGEVEVLRMVLLVAFVPVLFVVRRVLDGGERRGLGWWTIYGVLVAGALILTPGLAGHASTGTGPALGLVLDGVHLSAAALWLGGLALLAALLVSSPLAAESRAEVWSVGRRVSACATVAVVAVVATGVWQSIRQVGSFYALFNTVYGKTLVVKVSLVIVLICVGMVSRRLVLGDRAVPLLGRWRARAPLATRVPAAVGAGADGVLVAGATEGELPSAATGSTTATVGRGGDNGAAHGGESERDSRGLRRSVVAEITVGLAVLAVTALLVNAAPAKEAASAPYTQSFSTLGVQVNAVVSPARVGPGNQFHFYVLGPTGAPRAIPELDASISLPSSSIGPITIPLVVASPGHYLANDVTIPLAGDWQLELTVRTSPIDEQEVLGTLPVH